MVYCMISRKIVNLLMFLLCEIFHNFDNCSLKMVNYSFGAVSDLTDAAINNAIPSIAPVRQHVSVINSEVVVHPTIQAVAECDPSFAVAIDDTSTNNDGVPTVTATVIQDAVAVEAQPPSTPAAASATSVTNSGSQSIVTPDGASRNSISSDNPSSCTNRSPAANETSPTVAPSRNPYINHTAVGSNDSSGTDITSPAPAVLNRSTVGADSTTASTSSATTTHSPSANETTSPPVASMNPYASTIAASDGNGTVAVASSSSRATSPSGMSLSDVMAQLRSAPLTRGCAIAVNSSSCTKNYTRKKKKLLIEFVEALRAKSPKYDLIIQPAENVPSFFPQESGLVAEVFVLLSGKGDRRNKIRVLNEMLIDWVAEKENKGTGRRAGPNGRSKWPSPATLNTMVRTFFAATKEYYGWDFTTKDFNFERGYNGFFRQLVELRQREDVSIIMLYVCLRSA